MKLTQARIVTTSVTRLAVFYETVLSTVARGSEEYIELHTRGATLAISSQRAMDMYCARAAIPGNNQSIVLDFEVDDVDYERRRLNDIVASFVLEPTTQPWGNRSMLFRDPDGNLINFYSSER
jgi:uncharacterized glyoxalase superfamily protein PhnB